MVCIHCTIARPISCQWRPHIIPPLGPLVSMTATYYSTLAHWLQTACIHCPTNPSVANGSQTLFPRSAHWLPTVHLHCSIARPTGGQWQPYIIRPLGPSVPNGTHTLHRCSAHWLPTAAYIIPPLGPSVPNNIHTLHHCSAHRLSTAAIHYSTPRPIGSQR